MEIGDNTKPDRELRRGPALDEGMHHFEKVGRNHDGVVREIVKPKIISAICFCKKRE